MIPMIAAGLGIRGDRGTVNVHAILSLIFFFAPYHLLTLLSFISLILWVLGRETRETQENA